MKRQKGQKGFDGEKLARALKRHGAREAATTPDGVSLFVLPDPQVRAVDQRRR